MRYKLLILIITQPLFATHIVGGELTMEHVNGYKYNLKMTLFFDLLKGNMGALQNEINIVFFDKGTNRQLESFTLSMSGYADIKSRSGLCSNINIQTRIFTYEKIVTLDPAKYSGPSGFYGVWEACCRNASTTNIVSSGNSGSAFYSEFPPISVYTNSSPVFSNPTKIGFACVNTPFTYDFSATDSDNDSLTYEIVVPFRGHFTNSPYPQPVRPAPYPLVILPSGYNIHNLIPGNPPLYINSVTGILGFTASKTGIFAFSVKCNEYRKGVYIGSVRRDYQLAVDDCPINKMPGFKFRDPITQNIKNPSDTLLLDFSLGGCLDLLVINSIPGQLLSIESKGINFSDTLFISPTTYVSSTPSDTATIKICIPPCPNKSGFFLKAQIIVKTSNDCTVPIYDTLYALIKQATAPTPIKTLKFRQLGTRLFYKSGDTIPINLSSANCIQALYIDNLFEKKLISNVKSIDSTGSLDVKPVLYNINSTLAIDTASLDICLPACFQSNRPIIKIQVAFESIINSCPRYSYDTTFIYIENTVWKPLPPTPEINLINVSNDQPVNPGDTITINLMHPHCLNLVVGNALEHETISLSAKGLNFQEQVSISPDNHTFLAPINTFSAQLCLPKCPNTNDDYIKIQANMTSAFYCGSYRKDSLVFYIRNSEKTIKPPLIYTNLAGNQSNARVKKTTVFDVFSVANSEHTIYLSQKTPLNNSQFPSVSGKGTITSTFTFNPTCLELRPEPYNMVFEVIDSTCHGTLSDSVTTAITVTDTSGLSNVFTNIITPNDDRINDYFDISGFPPDNCFGEFNRIEIYNRWGKMIYVDSQKDFRWSAPDFADGIYFYVVKFTNAEYKSWLMIQR